MSDAELQTLAVQMDSILKSGYAPYGVTVGQSGALEAAKDGFGADLADVAAKKAAFRAAVEGKMAQRTSLTEVISTISAVIYNNPAVTPEMIAALGLQPRATSRAKQTPKTPLELLATPFANGDVKLVWKRGENSYGAVYVIETKIGSGAWTQVFSTTKTRTTLEGFTPGTAVWFRIRATRNGLWSSASNDAPIYAPAPEFELHLAA